MAVSYKATLSSILVFMITFCYVTARPGGEWSSRTKNGCNRDDTEKIEVCQRCAKQTKSPIVYPMCCNEEDEVHQWCIHYTHYGKES